jgi:hypothetical protein
MRDLPGYEGLYAATDEGRIWSYQKTSSEKGGRPWKPRFLRPWLIGNGYQMVILSDSERRKNKFLVHRLVAGAYIPNPENLPEVNHKDANRLNNRPDNLEWCTSKENKRHAWNLGLYDAVRTRFKRRVSSHTKKDSD